MNVRVIPLRHTFGHIQYYDTTYNVSGASSKSGDIPLPVDRTGLTAVACIVSAVVSPAMYRCRFGHNAYLWHGKKKELDLIHYSVVIG